MTNDELKPKDPILLSSNSSISFIRHSQSDIPGLFNFGNFVRTALGKIEIIRFEQGVH
jgi:hypothetical protein